MQASRTVCNATETVIVNNWQSPVRTENKCTFCERNGRELNPKLFQCSYPLMVTLEVRAPTFATIDNDTLWDGGFSTQTYDSLAKLTSAVGMVFVRDQLWVSQAFLNATTQKATVTLYSFPLTGDTMDKPLQTLITMAFTQQKVKYNSPFKPEIVQEIIPSQG